MRKYADALALLAITAWTGGLWGVGYLAVPVLFHALPDRMLAGDLAGRMFTLVSFLGMASAAYLMAYYASVRGKAVLHHPAFLVAGAMLLLTLAVQFGIQPMMADIKAQIFPSDVAHSPLAGRFGMLHGIASLCYLAQSLLGIALVLLGRRC